MNSKKITADIRKRQSDKNGLGKIFYLGFLGFIILTITSFLLLVSLSAVSCLFPDPLSIIKPMAITSIILSAIAGGILSKLCLKDHSIFSIILSSVFFLALTLIISLLFKSSISFDFPKLLTLIIRLLYIPLYFLGNIFGEAINSSKKNKRRHK